MATPIKRPYKVRTSWEDSKHQLGSYAYIDTAKDACIKAYKELESEQVYKVFKDTVCIYNPENDPDLSKPLFENTKGGKEMPTKIQPSTMHHYNTVDNKRAETSPTDHISIFQRIKNIFRKK